MSDTTNTDNTPTPNPSLPASPAQPSAVVPVTKPSLLDNPALIAAATGKKFTKNQFQPGNPGRPTGATEENLVKLLNALRTTFTIQGAANILGVTHRTVYNWQQANPEVATLIDMARGTRLEQLLKDLLALSRASKAEKSDGKDWRAVAWVIERLPWAHGKLFKRDPNAITPDVLAAKIGEIVARIIPMLPPERHAEAQAILAEICGSLTPKGGDDGGSDGGGDGR
jgi:hypothetical protein